MVIINEAAEICFPPLRIGEKLLDGAFGIRFGTEGLTGKLELSLRLLKLTLEHDDLGLLDRSDLGAIR